MPIPQKIIKFLGKNKTKYETIKHRTVYTAFDKAATLRVKLNLIGKTLVVKTGNDLAIVLIPANKNLDKNKFRKIAGVKKGDEYKSSSSPTELLRSKSESKEENEILFAFANARLTDFASEKLIKNRIKGVKVGAIPPFGELWKLPTFVDRALLKNPKIIVNSGDYNFSIKISPVALKKLIPSLVVGNFSKPRK